MMDNRQMLLDILDKVSFEERYGCLKEDFTYQSKNGDNKVNIYLKRPIISNNFIIQILEKLNYKPDYIKKEKTFFVEEHMNDVFTFEYYIKNDDISLGFSLRFLKNNEVLIEGMFDMFFAFLGRENPTYRLFCCNDIEAESVITACSKLYEDLKFAFINAFS